MIERNGQRMAHDLLTMQNLSSEWLHFWLTCRRNKGFTFAWLKRAILMMWIWRASAHHHTLLLPYVDDFCVEVWRDGHIITWRAGETPGGRRTIAFVIVASRLVGWLVVHSIIVFSCGPILTRTLNWIQPELENFHCRKVMVSCSYTTCIHNRELQKKKKKKEKCWRMEYA